MTNHTYIAGDVSKGYLDLYATDAAGSKLCLKKLFDVPNGHAELRRILGSYAHEGPVSFAVEATGGYERNWLATACGVREETADQVKVYQVNPLSVKRHLASQLHRNVNDQTSAIGICAYLRANTLPAQYRGVEDEGVKALYRAARDAISLVAKLKTQLLGLLSSVAPELVRHARNDTPDWLLQVLSQYGTAQGIAQAPPDELQACLDEQVNADALIRAARSSVASMSDRASVLTVKHLATQLRHALTMVEERKRDVISLVKDRPEIIRLTSIPGIGEWTAACLLLELGDFDRFATPEALSAFVGLDPRVHQSGDGHKRMSISRHGSSRIRGALWMPTLSAVTYNPTIRSFYQRLKAKGKASHLALVACMRKLLVIAWACGRKGGGVYDARHEETRRTRAPHVGPATTTAVTPSSLPSTDSSASRVKTASVTVPLDHAAAPISRRALKREFKKDGSAVATTRGQAARNVVETLPGQA